MKLIVAFQVCAIFINGVLFLTGIQRGYVLLAMIGLLFVANKVASLLDKKFPKYSVLHSCTVVIIIHTISILLAFSIFEYVQNPLFPLINSVSVVVTIVITIIISSFIISGSYKKVISKNVIIALLLQFHIVLSGNYYVLENYFS